MKWILKYMELLLLPQPTGNELKDYYHRALRESTELFIVSAYLTHWDVQEPLGLQCKTFVFIVGKDFGITRKAACESVIEWLPKHRRSQFLVAEAIDGFHPKAVFWKQQDGTCHVLLGSSNLSKAAFSSNHEANGYAKLSAKSYTVATTWVGRLAKNCVTLDSNWLSRYQEATQPRKPTKSPTPDRDDADDNAVFDLELPAPPSAQRQAEVLQRRRAQIRSFSEGRDELIGLFQKAKRARKWPSERNDEFYETLNELWSFSVGNRFQGAGWERQGKSSDFQEFSRSLVAVMDAAEIDRDQTVIQEIDRMANLRLRTRGALFSEMLCQLFPKDYYVLNRPVRSWLRATGVSKVRGDSSGTNYIRGARLLRAALVRNKRYPAKNLAELDALIWLVSNPDSVF